MPLQNWSITAKITFVEIELLKSIQKLSEVLILSQHKIWKFQSFPEVFIVWMKSWYM